MTADDESGITGRPLAEGLFCVRNGEPSLLGSECDVCSEVTFPQQDSCPRCGSARVRQRLLEPNGTLWTWTIQTFPPKPPFLAPDSFESFGVGYVELPGQLRVETRLTESDPSRLHIGMPMRLTLVPVPGHEELTTYAFAPV